MGANLLLSRLDKVKSTGRGRYVARCPAHDDRGPSLSIRELDDERVLIHCFAGCEPDEVLDAVGLDFEALIPERLGEYKRELRPFPAADILRCIAFEALVVATAGAALLAGEPFSLADRERLVVGVARIQEALSAGGLSHGK